MPETIEIAPPEPPAINPPASEVERTKPKRVLPPQFVAQIFTKETARIAGIKGGLNRWKYRPEPQPAQNAPEPPRTNPEPPVVDLFLKQRLTRTRKQIERLQTRLDTILEADEVDDKAIKSIADALARLFDVEGWLAGRPKPGNLRPSNPKSPKQSALSGPID